MDELQPDSTKKDKPKGLIKRLRYRREVKQAAETRGNNQVREIEGKIQANLNTVLPQISPEALQEALNVFYDHDIDSIEPSAENIHATIDRIMKQLETVNPNLAKLIEVYDSLSYGHDDDNTRYFFTMLLATLTHESTPQKK